ncbi:splicing factor 3B subunit 2 [Trichonephila clavipes]|nr:splicing factor 3B subunit 2 [Trichonephila clavipes]
MRRRPTMRKKVRLKTRISDINSPKLQNSVLKQLAKPKVTIHGDLCYERKAATPALWDGKRWRKNLQEGRPPFPFGGRRLVKRQEVKSDPFSKMTRALKSTWRTKGEKQR